MTAFQKWTPEHDAELVSAWNAGSNECKIAERLGVHESAVRDRLAHLIDIGFKSEMKAFRNQMPVRLASIAECKQFACAFYNVPASELVSNNRATSVVKVRHMAIRLAYELSGMSTTVIAKNFGGRDHTTIMYACRRVDAAYADEFNDLKTRLLAAKESAR